MQIFQKELFGNQQYDEKNFFLIAGPCVVESEALLEEVAEKVYGICKRLQYVIIWLILGIHHKQQGGAPLKNALFCLLSTFVGVRGFCIQFIGKCIVVTREIPNCEPTE